MVKYFNTEGSCKPEEHYMVRLDDRLARIKSMLVDRNKYFVINRGRQYGKTTILRALEDYLKEDYNVVSLDFQQLGTEEYADALTFTHAFTEVLIETLELNGLSDREELLKPLTELMSKSDSSLKDLFASMSKMCRNSAKPIVLMIDEVDSASNNQVFVDFLAQMRSYYLMRDKMPIFYSVILAGVYDIKNLKLKLRPESEHQYNSPWNIAAKFKIEMNFSVVNIAEMLQEYENDYHTGMDIQMVAEEIEKYTSGYPVLVSLICKHIDEDLPDEAGFENPAKAWTKKGVEKAVSMILKENPVLFESMAKQLDTYSDLKDLIEGIIYRGKRIPFSPEERSINLGTMFGYLKEENGHVAIANRIFEMVLL
ncbi:MAG: ATP-binding protein, partial [Lachnospiraceae bacterium]|nr:ATP-binding protein [Lachnospiraceae bacterium]